MVRRGLTSAQALAALAPSILDSGDASKFMTPGAPGGTLASLFTGLGGGQAQQPQMASDMSPEGLGASALGQAAGGQSDQPKQSFWKTPGGSILGSLLGVLGTSALGAGLGALSGGRRGAGEGAMLGGTKAFLTDLAQRQAMASAPALQQAQQEKLQQAMIEKTPQDILSAKMFGSLTPEQQSNFINLQLLGQKPEKEDPFLKLLGPEGQEALRTKIMSGLKPSTSMTGPSSGQELGNFNKEGLMGQIDWSNPDKSKTLILEAERRGYLNPYQLMKVAELKEKGVLQDFHGRGTGSQSSTQVAAISKPTLDYSSSNTQKALEAAKRLGLDISKYQHLSQ